MRRSLRSFGMMVACVAVSLAASHAAAQGNGNAVALGTLAVADEGEIMQAQYAAQNVTRTDVRDYANMLVTQHQDHLRMVQDTAAALGVTPDTSAASHLAATARRQLQQLQGVSGTELDNLFLAFMVQDHSGLQATLDGWIGGRRYPRLLPFLHGTRAVVHQHLLDARKLQRAGGGSHGMRVHKDSGR